MKSLNPRSVVLFALFACLLFTFDASAQCAMCKAVAQDAAKNQAYGTAEGLNAGIIFLMSVPYVLLAVLALAFFRKNIHRFYKSLNGIS